MNSIKENIAEIKTTIFYIICWGSGAVFLRLAAVNINLSKPDKIHYLFLIFLAVGLLLLLLPFFSKVKFGSVELEREIQQTKKEIGDLKTEVRQQLSIMSTNLNTIGNLNNQVNLYLPGSQEIKEEISAITEKLGDKKIEIEEIEKELLLPDEDKIMALAKTRIRIEFLLRSILEKRLSVSGSNKPIKFMALNQLIREFMKEYPNYKDLYRSFDYVSRICNAGIHAQQIDDVQISQALELGANIIVLLNRLLQSGK